MKKFKRRAAAGHISSTSQSPFYTYYISFRSSGSQESNSLNSVQIRTEIKKLWPLEDNRTKLKDNFASCKITNSTCEIKVQLVKWTLSTCKIFASHVSTCEIYLCNRRYLRPTLLDFFLRYFLFKSLFSPCNPPIIGFLSQEVSRKGEQPFYIIYCNFLLKDLSGVYLRDQLCIVLKKVIHRALLYLTYSF